MGESLDRMANSRVLICAVLLSPEHMESQAEEASAEYVLRKPSKRISTYFIAFPDG